MRIAIDLTPLHGRRWTGVELYGIDLYKALLTTEHVIIPIFHTKNDVDDNKEAFIIPKSNRILLENFKLSQAIREIKPDLIFFPIFPPPLNLYKHRPCKIVSVIHDTVLFRYYETLKFVAKYYLYPKYKKCLKLSDSILTISETSKKQLANYTKLPIVNWGENIAAEFKPENLKIDRECLKKWNLKEGAYYISVSTIEPRKNLKYTLRVLKDELIRKNMKLVLVGRRGWGNDKELEGLIEDMKDLIIFTEYISIEEMQSLYHFAFAFILLSLDEGFGRTPLEAIACGCTRIIVSDIEIFHETLGDNVTYISLDDLREAKSTISSGRLVNTGQLFSIPFNAIEKNIFGGNEKKSNFKRLV